MPIVLRNLRILGLALWLAFGTGLACSPRSTIQPQTATMDQATGVTDMSSESDLPGTQEATNAAAEAKDAPALATFGAGCFWCVEAVFQQMKGVLGVESGYAGGTVLNPTYEQVCSGTTGHAEVCQIRFDPSQVSYDELLEAFWQTHDPTTLNRQGNDVGTQYRSVIFYHDDQQREVAEKRMAQLDASGAWAAPLVTEISPCPIFYKAEEYHQNYYRSNPSQGYCQYIIRPKVEKFRKVFAESLKSDE